jgi:hypothetical protein
MLLSPGLAWSIFYPIGDRIPQIIDVRDFFIVKFSAVLIWEQLGLLF